MADPNHRYAGRHVNEGVLFKFGCSQIGRLLALDSVSDLVKVVVLILWATGPVGNGRAALLLRSLPGSPVFGGIQVK